MRIPRSHWISPEKAQVKNRICIWKRKWRSEFRTVKTASFWEVGYQRGGSQMGGKKQLKILCRTSSQNFGNSWWRRAARRLIGKQRFQRPQVFGKCWSSHLNRRKLHEYQNLLFDNLRNATYKEKASHFRSEEYTNGLETEMNLAYQILKLSLIRIRMIC